MARPSLAPNAEPESYGEAMMLCQGYAPACSDAETCGLDGFCFTKDGCGLAAARKQIAELIANAPDVITRVWLKLAADALEHHQFIGRKALDARKLIAINRMVRDLYNAPSPSLRENTE